MSDLSKGVKSLTYTLARHSTPLYTADSSLSLTSVKCRVHTCVEAAAPDILPFMTDHRAVTGQAAGVEEQHSFGNDFMSSTIELMNFYTVN